MNGRSPFLAMYDMWGLNVSLKRAKEMGLEVTKEEIDEAVLRDKAIENLFNQLFNEMTEKKEER